MILVCAATRTEAAACRRGIADAGSLDVEVLTTGVGPDRSSGALRRRLAQAPRRDGAPAAPALIVSSGFAGALTPDLERLEWVTATAVYRVAGAEPVLAALPRALLRVAEGATRCEVVSADAVVACPVSGLTSPVVVDMESAALAEVAGSAGIPFCVLRLVTDTPAQPLAALGRRLAATLAASTLHAAAVHGTGAVIEAARSPGRSLRFVRDALVWREQLRAGWCAHVRRPFGAITAPG